ncbi:hypothetical protein B0J11DRAFT_618496 [Dendryphion nanum]|uniref:Uncharacterized protein n=1 Tax=Dendryphion nanum TaxID=256645 RepID=A0A9P9DBX4_9PLEO|nr:hypothetical protein B0J11DRAFT_618496 [Dendryphion nanum]
MGENLDVKGMIQKLESVERAAGLDPAELPLGDDAVEMPMETGTAEVPLEVNNRGVISEVVGPPPGIAELPAEPIKRYNPAEMSTELIVQPDTVATFTREAQHPDTSNPAMQQSAVSSKLQAPSETSFDHSAPLVEALSEITAIMRNILAGISGIKSEMEIVTSQIKIAEYQARVEAEEVASKKRSAVTHNHYARIHNRLAESDAHYLVPLHDSVTNEPVSGQPENAGELNLITDEYVKSVLVKFGLDTFADRRRNQRALLQFMGYRHWDRFN